jgi:hypothetical protein
VCPLTVVRVHFVPPALWQPCQQQLEHTEGGAQQAVLNLCEGTGVYQSHARTYGATFGNVVASLALLPHDATWVVTATA